MPGWGTDTYTLTCYGAAGSQPATQSLLNTTGFNADDFENPSSEFPPENPLAITSFITDGEGNLTWITANSTDSTVCTITDAYGGAPYNLAPTENLSASSAETPYQYFCSNPIRGTGIADLLTLTCSDPNNGTDMKTLSITNPEGCESD
jgi:hypothetical protein